MDPMVLKYLGLAGVTFGVHAYLTVAQVALCLYLVVNGFLLLSAREDLGKWPKRLGLVANGDLSGNKVIAFLMLVTGVAFILPLLGASYWVAVVACPVAIVLIVKSAKSLAAHGDRKIGRLVRTGLVLSAIVVCGFTVWEEKDLVYTGVNVIYKSAYWRNVEVEGWQKENDPNAPKAGEVAPDFELTGVDGITTMRLSDYRGEKPVVLLFGSFT
jgi:hypothetical protein